MEGREASVPPKLHLFNSSIFGDGFQVSVGCQRSVSFMMVYLLATYASFSVKLVRKWPAQIIFDVAV